MIIGQPGSGKSTLARELGLLTGLPVIHIDQILWKTGWIERSTEDRGKLISKVHQQESWIFEGNYPQTIPERIAQADTCIWLDFPLGLRLWRVIARTLHYHGTNRPDLPEGCPERFTMEFFWWIISTRKSGRGLGQNIIDNTPSHLTVHQLRNAQHVLTFLENIKAK